MLWRENAGGSTGGGGWSRRGAPLPQGTRSLTGSQLSHKVPVLPQGRRSPTACQLSLKAPAPTLDCAGLAGFGARDCGATQSRRSSGVVEPGFIQGYGLVGLCFGSNRLEIEHLLYASSGVDETISTDPLCNAQHSMHPTQIRKRHVRIGRTAENGAQPHFRFAHAIERLLCFCWGSFLTSTALRSLLRLCKYFAQSPAVAWREQSGIQGFPVTRCLGDLSEAAPTRSQPRLLARSLLCGFVSRSDLPRRSSYSLGCAPYSNRPSSLV